jgi:hypothetical protein
MQTIPLAKGNDRPIFVNSKTEGKRWLSSIMSTATDHITIDLPLYLHTFPVLDDKSLYSDITPSSTHNSSFSFPLFSSILHHHPPPSPKVL